MAIAVGLTADPGSPARMLVGDAEAAGVAKRVSNASRLSSIRVAQGKSETLEIERSFSDITVGDPEVADVVPLNDQTLYVLGKKIGTTNLSIFDRSKALVGVIEVEVSYDVSRLQAELKAQVPSGAIRVGTANGRVILSGSVRDAASLERAMTVARQFAPDVINAMTVGTSQQVVLEVRFIEAQRTAAREFGINLLGRRSSTSTNVPPFPRHGGNRVDDQGTILFRQNGAVGITGSNGLLSGSPPFGTIIATMVGGGLGVDAVIQALEEQQVARRLAEPNLVALSGQPAHFLAGGRVPIIIPGTLGGAPVVEYKEYGVRLAFTPTVLDNGLINLRIAPSVTELDYANAVAQQGILQPAFTERSTETTIELRDGQSFAVAGLLQTKSATLINQFPWLGSVPVLGALFRSTSFQKDETELVIMVTPRLVKPMGLNVASKNPLDSRVVGNDVDVFLNGQPELTRTQARRQDGGVPRPVQSGHVIDVPTSEKRRPNASRP